MVLVPLCIRPKGILAAIEISSFCSCRLKKIIAMDSISLISDRSKTKSEEYYTKLLNKNCEIFKALDLNNWKEIKKKERNECAHYLKKWKCYSAACALESCTRSFMDSIECLERKMTILSELKKSNKMITESEEMYKVMKKGSTFNKENVSTMKNNYLLKRDVAKYPVSDLYISEKRQLTFERINELLKISNEGEKEIEKLRQMKKQLAEK